MLGGHLKELVRQLLEGEYKTAKQLAEVLGVSEKTVRIRLKELQLELEPYGGEITSKARFGYRLVWEKEDRGEEVLRIGEGEEKIPDTAEERIYFLLAYLINYDNYIKLDDLSEFLYISRTSLTGICKRVEEIMAPYGITVERRPGYGIRAQGSEFDFRRCIGDYFIKHNLLEEEQNVYQEKKIQQIGEVVRRLLQQYGIRLSEVAMQNMVIHLYIAKRRLLRCRRIEKLDVGTEASAKEMELARVLAKEVLGEELTLKYPEEVNCIWLHLAGKRMIGGGEGNDKNFVIREKMDYLVMQMLEMIYEEFRIDLRNNFDLRMSLNQHMVPLDIRIRFQITMDNPVLEEIKSNYILAYTIAMRAVRRLEEYYKTEISEEETGYFAVLFALALEQQGQNVRKRDILIVCGSGKGTSQLLRYKYQKEFGDYIDQIYICGQSELREFDFHKVQYVFTTVPISYAVPIPILEVGIFLEQKDIYRVREVLQTGNGEYLQEFYRKDAFFPLMKGESKEDVLKNIISDIKKQRDIPEDFFEAVMRREEMGTTDYGNKIAIPHPMGITLVDTFVYVAVLEHPVWWGRNEVQVVFLGAVGDIAPEQLQKFYEATTNLLLKKEAIEALILSRNYEHLMALLQER